MFSNKCLLLVALLAATVPTANASIVGSKLHFARALQDAVTDDDIIGDECNEEFDAMDACTMASGGTCTEECMDQALPEMSDDPFGGQGEPDFTSVDSLNAVMGTMNEYLAGICTASKEGVCTMVKDCCPDCGDEIKAVMDCGLEASKNALESMTGESMELLANLTGAEITPVTLECDVKGHSCDGSDSGSGSTSETATSESGSGASVLPLAFSMVMVGAGMFLRVW